MMLILDLRAWSNLVRQPLLLLFDARASISQHIAMVSLTLELAVPLLRKFFEAIILVHFSIRVVK